MRRGTSLSRLAVCDEPVHGGQEAVWRFVPEEVSRAWLNVRPGPGDALGTVDPGAGWDGAQLAYEHAYRDPDRRERRLQLGLADFQVRPQPLTRRP